MHSAISTNYREVEDLVEGHVYFVELSALVVWNFPSLSENTTSRARYYMIVLCIATLMTTTFAVVLPMKT
jgi:hypothetical protein